MRKICNCGYETGKKNFNFCPLCGTKLTVLELEKDGIYKAGRKACRVVDEWCDPKKIYYYKESHINKEYVWIYKSLHDDMNLCQYFGQKKLKDYDDFLSSSSSFCCGVR